MSIPDRIWRVAKGYWEIAGDRLADAEAKLAQAAAYDELAEHLNKDRQETPTATASTLPPVPPLSGVDPLAASYELLALQPNATMGQVDNAYQERLRLWDPSRFPAGTPERTAAESQVKALTAAYDRIRDQLNPTETRFERLEFE
jgi:hypothetical protein